MTAYEELKAWCEKHLEPEEWKDVPTTETFFHCIYVSACFSCNADDDGIGFVGFFNNGLVASLGLVTQCDMNAHIEEYKEQVEG